MKKKKKLDQIRAVLKLWMSRNRERFRLVRGDYARLRTTEKKRTYLNCN